MHAGNGPTSDTETQALEESQGAPDYYIRYSYFDLRGNHNHSFSGTTADNNGSSAAETRPKNLNFWTYIRVN